MTRRTSLMNVLIVLAVSVSSAAAAAPPPTPGAGGGGGQSRAGVGPIEHRVGGLRGGDPAPRSTAFSALPSMRTAEAIVEINGGFEVGLLGWQVIGPTADVAVVTNNPPPQCFDEMPSEGLRMACLSTESFFGQSANGSVRSDLTSEEILFPFKPSKITVSFTVDFRTEEPIPSIAFNDSFQARLVTLAGTFVMLQIDTFAHTTSGGGLSVQGFVDFEESPPACPLVDSLGTGKLTVTWSRVLDSGLRRAIGTGPVFIEFSIADQGGIDRTSIACIDEVTVKVSKPD